MDIEEFRSIVKQCLGVDCAAERKENGGISWLEIVQGNESATIRVTYRLGSKIWDVQISRKFNGDDPAVGMSRYGCLVHGPDFEEGGFLLVNLSGSGRTLAEAISAALFQ